MNCMEDPLVNGEEHIVIGVICLAGVFTMIL